MGFREFFGLAPREQVDEAKSSTPTLPQRGEVTRDGFEFGIGPQGLNEYTGQYSDAGGGADRATLLGEFYDAFLACPWSWACVNAIARTITGGPLVFDWDSDDGEGDQETPDKPEDVKACERLLNFCNPREDIRQLMRGAVADLCVFGDAFIEVVWIGNLPVAMFSLDAPTIFPTADEHGQVSGYVQITEAGQRADFEPRQVIHISLDSPRSGIFGVPPTQAALLPITEWLFTSACLKEFYRKGAPLTLHVNHPSEMQSNDVKRWEQQHRSQNLGPKNIGNPITTHGAGADAVRELGQQRIAEMLHTLDQKRDEIISTYGVPPAEVGIIESGNLGGGTGESQRRSFLINTCQPIAALILEKLNFHLCQRGFGIEGWALKFEEVDLRDSKTVEDIRDMRLRNGSWTVNRYRAEIGEPPIEGGDVALLVDRQNFVLFRDLAAYSRASIARATRGTDLTLLDPEDIDNPAVLTRDETPDERPALPPGVTPVALPGEEPPGQETYRYRGRPVRERWATDYRERVRQGLAELPEAS